jgi:hypothetical protein
VLTPRVLFARNTDETSFKHHGYRGISRVQQNDSVLEIPSQYISLLWTRYRGRNRRTNGNVILIEPGFATASLRSVIKGKIAVVH